MKKSGLLMKMFISYLALLIPLFCILLVAFYGITSEYRKIDDSRITLTVEQVMDVIDNKYKEFASMGQQISSSPEILPSEFFKGESHILDGIERIRSISAYDDMVSDCLVYYNSDRIYSIRGSSSVDTFVKITLDCDEKNEEIIKNLIADNKRGVALAENSNYLNSIILHFPFDATVANGQGSVNICIKIDEFVELLNPLLQVEEMYVKVDLDNGQAIYLSGNSETGFMQINKEEYPLIDTTNHWITKNAVSRYLGMDFSFAWRYDKIYANISRYQLFLYITLTVLLLISVLISYKISYTYWKKTKSVVDIVGTAITKPDINNTKDEWDLIRTAVGGIIEENINSKLIISEYKQAFRQQVSLVILHGTYNNLEQIDQMLELCKLDIYEEYYAVCIVCVSEEKIEEAWDILQEEFPDDILCINKISDTQVFELLLQLPNEDDGGHNRANILNKLQNLFQNKEEFNIPASIVISNVYSQKHMIAFGWMEAIEKLQIFLDDKSMPSQYICSEKITESKKKIIEADQDKLDFEKAIEEKDAVLAESILDRMVLVTDENDKEKIYYRCFCILRYMIILLQSNNIEMDRNIRENVMSINIGDISSFLLDMKSVIRYYCKQESSTDFDSILKYIEENYWKNNFSLENIAEKFNFSKTYFSRMFKQKMGCKYIDYLSNLRMEEARKELITTDLSIQEIAENIGYFDVPGFRKKFKQTYGINASQYRKENSKDFN